MDLPSLTRLADGGLDPAQQQLEIRKEYAASLLELKAIHELESDFRHDTTNKYITKTGDETELFSEYLASLSKLGRVSSESHALRQQVNVWDGEVATALRDNRMAPSPAQRVALQGKLLYLRELKEESLAQMRAYATPGRQENDDYYFLTKEVDVANKQIADIERKLAMPMPEE